MALACGVAAADEQLKAMPILIVIRITQSAEERRETNTDIYSSVVFRRKLTLWAELASG